MDPLAPFAQKGGFFPDIVHYNDSLFQGSEFPTNFLSFFRHSRISQVAEAANSVNTHPEFNTNPFGFTRYCGKGFSYFTRIIISQRKVRYLYTFSTEPPHESWESASRIPEYPSPTALQSAAGKPESDGTRVCYGNPVNCREEHQNGSTAPYRHHETLQWVSGRGPFHPK